MTHRAVLLCQAPGTARLPPLSTNTYIPFRASEANLTALSW